MKGKPPTSGLLLHWLAALFVNVVGPDRSEAAARRVRARRAAAGPRPPAQAWLHVLPVVVLGGLLVALVFQLTAGALDGPLVPELRLGAGAATAARWALLTGSAAALGALAALAVPGRVAGRPAMLWTAGLGAVLGAAAFVAPAVIAALSGRPVSLAGGTWLALPAAAALLGLVPQWRKLVGGAVAAGCVHAAVAAAGIVCLIQVAVALPDLRPGFAATAVAVALLRARGREVVHAALAGVGASAAWAFATADQLSASPEVVGAASALVPVAGAALAAVAAALAARPGPAVHVLVPAAAAGCLTGGPTVLAGAVVLVAWAAWVGRAWMARSMLRGLLVVLPPLVGLVTASAFMAAYLASVMLSSLARSAGRPETEFTQLPQAVKAAALITIGAVAVVAWRRRHRHTSVPQRFWLGLLWAGAAGFALLALRPDASTIWVASIAAAIGVAAAMPLQVEAIAQLRRAAPDRVERLKGRIDAVFMGGISVALFAAAIASDASRDAVTVAGLPSRALPVLALAAILVAGIVLLPAGLRRLRELGVDAGTDRASLPEIGSYGRAVSLTCLQVAALAPVEGLITIVFALHGLSDFWAGVALLAILVPAPCLGRWATFVAAHTRRAEIIASAVTLSGVALWAAAVVGDALAGEAAWRPLFAVGYLLLEMGTTFGWTAAWRVALGDEAPVWRVAQLNGIRLLAAAIWGFIAAALFVSHDEGLNEFGLLWISAVPAVIALAVAVARSRRSRAAA